MAETAQARTRTGKGRARWQLSILSPELPGVFVYAISLGIAREDPAAMIIRALKPKRKAGRQPAIIDLTELRSLLNASERSGAYPVTLLASRLLAITAVRPGVVRGARWDEFKGIDWEESIFPSLKYPDGIWHIPAERMKLLLDRKDEASFDQDFRGQYT